jgi:hypothetical protein
MRNDWILDVLADLRTFARENGLPELAERLDDAQQVAVAEIARMARPLPVVVSIGACEGDAKGVREGR